MPRGRAIEELVEEIDIYPTLAELAGLPPPPGNQGKSLASLLRAKDATATDESTAVFSQYPHYQASGTTAGNFSGRVMGYSMRTTGWRYTAWLAFKCDVMAPMKDCARAPLRPPPTGRERARSVWSSTTTAATPRTTRPPTRTSTWPRSTRTWWRRCMRSWSRSGRSPCKNGRPLLMRPWWNSWSDLRCSTRFM
mmetsp:Transcript_40801/g.132142  ORF Transcript_40801/g.132142 Transcript_40801/m.132142 type:complete len:194 (+) Transcript_40801:343-924(+)